MKNEIKNLKFSVLMSVYINENPIYFEVALKSIIDQTRKPDEILIVKDGKLTDDLEEIIKKYKNKYSIISTLELENNVGLGKALSIGIKKCKYTLVARMDTDDIAKPNRFEKQIEIFFKNTEIDIVGSWVEEFEEIDKKIYVKSIKKLPEKNSEIIRLLKKRNPMNHPSVMFKKDVVIRNGNYSEKYNRLEDYYLWFNLAIKKCEFYNIQEVLLSFRVNEATFNNSSPIDYAVSTAKHTIADNIIQFRTFLTYFCDW